MNTSYDPSDFIWAIADFLRGPYRPPKYERVMRPLVVLRRFDCLRKSSTQAVLNNHPNMCDKLSGEALDDVLNQMSGQRFHNNSPFIFECSLGHAEWARALRIRFDDFREFLLPFRPRPEQEHLFDFVKNKTQPLVELASPTQRTLILLSALRAGLIESAVCRGVDLRLEPEAKEMSYAA